MGAEATAANTALLRSAVRKCTLRIVPVMTLAFGLNQLDRTNIGFAALTMNRDLALTATEFGFGAGLLFVSYALIELPSNLMLYRLGARVWITRIMITWGLAAAATALTTGPLSFYAIRLLVGAAEGGFAPGAYFLLGQWFPTGYRARVIAGFTLASPISSLIGGPLSAALLAIDGFGGLRGWQWLFIVEGVPACLVGVLVYALLRDTPAQAAFLSAPERQALLAALAAEQRQRPPHSLRLAFVDKRLLLMTAILFFYLAGSFGVSIWLPQLLKLHGVGNTTVGWLTTIPYLASIVGTLAWASYADRHGNDTLHLTLSYLLAALCLVLSIVFDGLAVDMLFLSLSMVGIGTARALFWNVPSRFLTGANAAGGLALMNSVATFGAVVGPFMVGWIGDLTGSIRDGVLFLAGLLAASMALSIALHRMMR